MEVPATEDLAEAFRKPITNVIIPLINIIWGLYSYRELLF